MDGRRSRSHSQSSSCSSRSWSLVENPEREVREVQEMSELESSCVVTDCSCECTEVEERHGVEATTDDYSSEPESDISALDESVELLSGSIKKKNVDLREVCHQLDVLSKCYEPPAERLLNSFFGSDSRVKIFTLLAVAALPFTVATLLKLAGSNRKYASHMDIHDSVCILNEEQLFDQNVSHLLRSSLEEPLRPLSLSAVPLPITSSKASSIPRFNYARTKHEDIRREKKPSNNCAQKENERKFLAMRDAVRRYVAHTNSRRARSSETRHSKVVTTKALSSNTNTRSSCTNRLRSGRSYREGFQCCARWPMPYLNLTMEKPKNVLEAIIAKTNWKNVTNSLLRIPDVARKLFATSTMVKIVAESRLAAKFQNAFSSMKRSVNWSIAKVRMQRDRTVRAIAYSMAKIASLSPPKLWLKGSRCASTDSPPEKRCTRNSTCHSLATLGHVLHSTHQFSSLVGRRNAEVYIKSLRDGSACSASRVACEKCWWTGECLKERCKFLAWQKSFDTLRFIASEPDMMLKSFATLGWPIRDQSGTIHRQTDLLLQPVLQKTIAAGPSETKDEMNHEMSSWVFERSQRRAQQRMDAR